MDNSNLVCSRTTDRISEICFTDKTAYLNSPGLCSIVSPQTNSNKYLSPLTRKLFVDFINFHSGRYDKCEYLTNKNIFQCRGDGLNDHLELVEKKLKSYLKNFEVNIHRNELGNSYQVEKSFMCRKTDYDKFACMGNFFDGDSNVGYVFDGSNESLVLLEDKNKKQWLWNEKNKPDLSLFSVYMQPKPICKLSNLESFIYRITNLVGCGADNVYPSLKYDSVEAVSDDLTKVKLDGFVKVGC